MRLRIFFTNLKNQIYDLQKQVRFIGWCFGIYGFKKKLAFRISYKLNRRE
jgi:hypothetical protein